MIFCSTSLGQAFNIDAGLIPGAGELPGSNYGAAAGQLGQWTYGVGSSINLIDTSGFETPARLGITGGGAGGTLSGIPTSDVDEQRMMSSYIGFSGTTSTSASVADLEAGWYDVYVYCWSGPSSPLNGFSRPGITIRFEEDSYFFQPATTLAWPGFQVEGVTYVRARGYIDNAMQIDYFVPTNRNSVLSGIQLVPVPGPGAGFVLVAGLSIGSIRRRR